MDYVSVIEDSVETSVCLGIFTNKQKASFAHIFKSELVKIPLSIFTDVENFDPVRLCKSAVKAYPICNRPRGDKDISSVKYYQKLIQQKKGIPAIWLARKNKKYILLDGCHRVVAAYCECKRHISAYVIDV